MKYILSKKQLAVIAIINIVIITADKIILMQYDAYCPPVLLTIILWFFIFRSKRWAYIAYSVLSLLAVASGLLGLVLSFSYIFRGFDPIPSVLMAIVGISYAISWINVRKTYKAK